MNSLVLHRSIALFVSILLGYVVAEFGYLGQLRFELSRRAENAELLADIDSRLAELRDQLVSIPVLSRPTGTDGFTESTPDQSLIVMQETIQALLASSGGVSMAIQGGQAPDASGLTRLTVLVRASFPEQSLLAFLRQIESLPNGITVQRLEALPPSLGQVGSPMLDVTIILGAIHSHAL